MTWFSDWSGIASTGIVNIAREPATPTASAARMTRTRLRIDHSMIDSITGLASLSGPVMGAARRRVAGLGRRAGRGLEPRLGVEQERPGRGDPLARQEAVEDGVEIAG